ncbi:MAG: PAS domain S-box protein [Ignavibacteria bacterium]|nr:PAS domain S-box protein [Ignavibacteria bacterium]
MNEDTIYKLTGKAAYINVIIDRNFCFHFFNEFTFNYIKKYTGHEIRKGEPFLNLLTPKNVEKFKSAFEKAFKGNPVKIELTFAMDNSETLFYEAFVTPLAEEDTPVMYVSVSLFEITGLKKTIKELEETEERYKSLVKLHTNIIARTNKDSIITYANDACCEFMGVSNAELLQKNVLNFIHPDDLSLMSDKIKGLKQPPHRDDIEIRLITNHGIKWLHAEGVAVFDEDGNISEFQILGRDITETKKSFQELINTRYRLGAILNNFSGIVLYELGRDGGFISSNVTNLLGYDPVKLSKENFLPHIIFSEDYEIFIKNFEEWKKANEPEYLQQNFRCIKSDGGIIWVENILTKVNDGQGVYYCGVLRDISKRIEFQEKTFWNESLLRIMAHSAKLGYYVVNLYSDEILYVNEMFCDLWGITDYYTSFSLQKLSNTHVRELCSSFIIEKEKFIEASMRYSRPENQISFEDEVELINGRTLRRFSSILNDSNGKYLGRFFLLEDITDKKLYEKTLKSHQNYQMIIEEAVDAIFICDTNSVIINVNNKACEILGFSKKELTGVSIIDLVYEPELAKTPFKFAEAVEGKTIILKRYLKRKNGSLVFVESHAKMLPNNLIQAIIWERKDDAINLNVEPGRDTFYSLISKVKAFKHGESSLMCLNRISLFLLNINYLETPDDLQSVENRNKLVARFELLLTEFNITVYPQIEFISAQLNVILKDMPRITVYNELFKANEKLISSSRVLKNRLIELQESIRRNRGISGLTVKSGEIVELTRNSISCIKIITRNLEESFTSDIEEVFKVVCGKFESANQEVKINRTSNCEDLKIVFNSAELTELLSIFLKNSYEAFESYRSNNSVNQIDIKCSRDNDTIVLEFADNGPGLPERLKKQMFGRGISTKGEHRGFGLSYANNTVKKYGGKMQLDSTYINGTKFIITLNVV